MKQATPMRLDYREDKRYAHLTPEQVRAHCEVEGQLRRYLLGAPRERRKEVRLAPA